MWSYGADQSFCEYDLSLSFNAIKNIVRKPMEGVTSSESS